MARRAVAAALLAAAVTGLAGCGSGGSGTNDSSAARADLASAARALGDASSVTTTLRFDTTAAKLENLEAGPNSNLPPPVANALASASVVIQASARSGQQLSDVKSFSDLGAMSVTVNSGGKAIVDLRDVNQTIYLQLDLRDLLTATGSSTGLATLRHQVAKAPGFVRDLIGGKWVAVRLSTLQTFAGLIQGGLSGSGRLPPTPSGSQTRQLVSQLRAALARDLSVTRAGSGGTEQLTITGNLRTVARDVVGAITQAVPLAAAGLGSADPSKVPDRTASVAASITNGVLSRLSLDLGQFASASQHVTLPLVATFARRGGTISAPPRSTQITSGSLGQLFSSLVGGALGGGQ